MQPAGWCLEPAFAWFNPGVPVSSFPVFAKALARQYDLDGHPSYSMRHFNSLLVNFVLCMLSAAPAKRMLQNEACVALSYIDCDGDRSFAARPFRTGVRAVWERELRGLGSNAELLARASVRLFRRRHDLSRSPAKFAKNGNSGLTIPLCPPNTFPHKRHAARKVRL